MPVAGHQKFSFHESEFHFYAAMLLNHAPACRLRPGVPLGECSCLGKLIADSINQCLSD
jgi:hypothetical protein